MATGYTRNDSINNIADGNIINASDLDGEFDAIVAAFNASTGHNHDGAAANGSPITKIGPAQNLVVSSGAIIPSTDDAIDLGSSSFQFKDAYIDGTAYIDTLEINGTVITPTGTELNFVDGVTSAIQTQLDAKQPLDAELTALAGLTSAADKVPYFTGSGTAAVADFSAFGRTLVDDANASAARTTLGVVIGTDVQAFDAQLTDVAGLTPTDNNFIVGNGTNFVTESGATARTSLGLGSIATQDSNNVTITGGSVSGITDLAIADGGTGASTAPNARTNLGLVIGTDVQAFDAQLADVAGLTPTDNGVIIGNGTNFVVETGNTLRTSLGLAIGTDVQAFDAQLTDVAGLTPTDGGVIVGDGTNFVIETGNTLRTSLGLAIGTDVQAFDTELTTIAGLTPTNNFAIIGNGTTWVSSALPASGVTSVTGTSPVNSSGGATPAISLASGYGDTLNPYASKTANFVLAAPDGASGTPTFRAVAAADIPTLNQNTTGSAATLTTGRTIAITGDLSYTSGSFNGSGNVTGTGTLSTVNSNTGSFGSTSSIPVITVNAKGLITAVTTAAVAGGATISNDTTTATDLFPLYASATSGVPATIFTSNAKYLYKPSTGELQASELVASNGIVVNNQTISASYTIAAGNNAMSAGPVTVASGQTVTVSSGCRWVVL